jgi:hypothetical protein
VTEVGGDRGPAPEEVQKLAQRVRDACLRAAVDAHQDAGLAGLCEEGRWEAAIDAIRSLKLDPVVRPTDDGPA